MISKLLFGVNVIDIFPSMLLIFACFWMAPCIADDAQDFHNNLPAHVVWAAPGKDVKLPCDVTPPTPHDTVNMVLWFKDSAIPLYSLDSRGGPLEHANHSALGSDLGRRVYFVLGESNSPQGAGLEVKNIQTEDGGVFRCRVDFSNSPTRNFKVNLTLVVPPSEPQIFDDQGREVNSIAGPFREGFDLFLSCQVSGGMPRPKVTWWRDNQLIDEVVDTEAQSDTTVNQLFLRSITRDFYGGALECRAQGTHLLAPLVKVVHLHIYLKPVRVKIVTPNELLSAGTSHHLRCETWGSIPPAKITWLLDGEPIRNSAITVSPNDLIGNGSNNTTSSILTLGVVAQDGGKELICRAANPWFNGAIIEDKRAINVAYAPIVSIRLTDGAAPVSSNIPIDPFLPPPILTENGRAELHCQAESRPAVHTYIWFKDNAVLNPGHNGMTEDKGTLRIPKVDRSTAGVYVCGAANTEGETRSAPLVVKVHFAPRCKTGFEERSVGALRHGTLTVRCEVDADPIDNTLKFSWTYNNTRDVLPMPSSRVTSSGTVSQLQYTPVSGVDYGTLACWASNSAGRQKTPCLFHVVPAKTPQSPADCSLNEQLGGLEVSCTAGFDGGLEQHFLLEVVYGSVTPTPPLDGVGTQENEISTMNDQSADSPLYRVTATDPHFRLHSLQPGREYQLMVWAVNARGRSEPPVVIDRVRVALPLGRMGSSEDPPGNGGDVLGVGDGNQRIPPLPENNMALVLGALIGAAGLILSAIIFATIIVICKKRSRSSPPQTPSTQVQKRIIGTEGPSMYSAEPDDDGFSEFGEGFRSPRRSTEITITPLRHSRASRHLPDSIVRYSQPCMNEPDLVLARSVDPGFIRSGP